MTFIPSRSAISAISRAKPCVVTTTNANSLSTGEVVRIKVPKNYGMNELNNQLFIITVLSTTTFSLQYSQVPPSIDVDSTNYTTFIIPSNPSFTAEVIAVGAGPTPLNSPPVYANNNTCISETQDATENNSTSEIPY